MAKRDEKNKFQIRDGFSQFSNLVEMYVWLLIKKCTSSRILAKRDERKFPIHNSFPHLSNLVEMYVCVLIK